MKKKIFATGLAVLIGTAGLAVLKADANSSPTQVEVDRAAGTSMVLINSLVAGLVNLVLATSNSGSSIAQGSQALSIIYDDRNENMRLVGQSEPLSENSRPMDSFEVTALSRALAGQTYTSVERVMGSWYYRSSVPLANGVAQCAFCHTNFGPPDAADYKGALMVRVLIPKNNT